MAIKVSDIVRDAFVRGAVLAEGQLPNAQQMARGTQYLLDLYKGMAANGVLATLEDKYVTANYTAKEGERVYVNPNTVVVTIPTTVQDRFTGRTRAPRDGAVISVVNLAAGPQFWVYDAPSATWEDLYAATQASSTAPLAFSYHKDLVALVAEELASKGGIPVDQALAGEVVAARMHLTKRGSDRTVTQRVRYF